MASIRRLQPLLCLSLFLVGATSIALEEGDTVPDFDIASIYADKPNIKLSELKGKTLYIDFWASWCAPCVLSLPLYNEMYHKYKDQGLEVIAVNVDNPIEDGLDFLLDTPLDFLIPQDPEGNISELFGVIGMPSSYLVTPDGTVKMVHMGFRNGDMETIEEELVKVLAGD